MNSEVDFYILVIWKQEDTPYFKSPRPHNDGQVARPRHGILGLYFITRLTLCQPDEWLRGKESTM